MIPIIFGLSHLCFVIVLAFSIATSSDPVAVNAWLVVLPLDFPVSLGLYHISDYFDGTSILSSKDSLGNYSVIRDLNNFWVPAFYSGILGSYWWYSLPKIFVWLKSRIFKLSS